MAEATLAVVDWLVKKRFAQHAAALLASFFFSSTDSYSHFLRGNRSESNLPR